MWWRWRAREAGFRLGRALKTRLPGKQCVNEFVIDVDVIIVVVVDVETNSFSNGDGWRDVIDLVDLYADWLCMMMN